MILGLLRRAVGRDAPALRPKSSLTLAASELAVLPQKSDWRDRRSERNRGRDIFKNLSERPPFMSPVLIPQRMRFEAIKRAKMARIWPYMQVSAVPMDSLVNMEEKGAEEDISEGIRYKITSPYTAGSAKRSVLRRRFRDVLYLVAHYGARVKDGEIILSRETDTSPLVGIDKTYALYFHIRPISMCLSYVALVDLVHKGLAKQRELIEKDRSRSLRL